MVLVIAGVGLDYDLTTMALKRVKGCELVFLEAYTNPVPPSGVNYLRKIIKKEVKLLSRKDVEQDPKFLKLAKSRDVAFLVPGDPFIATTHVDLFLRAKELKLDIVVFHASSVLTGVCESGLSAYRFGEVVSVPRPDLVQGYDPKDYFKTIARNKKAGLHTLLLLDINLRIPEALELLLRDRTLFTEKTKLVAVARLGFPDKFIVYASIKDLLKIAFPDSPHALVLPGKLHFMEKDALEKFAEL